jgi:fluoride exporter
MMNSPMNSPMTLVLIAVGGAVGSLSRYGMSRLVQRSAHTGFPVGTLVVNVVGCILVGMLAKGFMNTQAHQELRALLIIGFCGGFTTFSAFSLETIALAQGGEWMRAGAYVAASLLLCLAGTAIGFAVMRSP